MYVNEDNGFNKTFSIPAFTVCSSSIPDSFAATPKTENNTILLNTALNASAVHPKIDALKLMILSLIFTSNNFWIYDI